MSDELSRIGSFEDECLGRGCSESIRCVVAGMTFEECFRVSRERTFQLAKVRVSFDDGNSLLQR